MARDIEAWFDEAQVCLNGHLINSQVRLTPYLSQPYCEKCGAPTITSCTKCGTPIRGAFHEPGIFIIQELTVPAYCLGCGSAYPWTLQRLEAARSLADELQTLKPAQREALKRSIDELVHETPHSQAAALQFKRLLAQAGTEAANGMKEILVSIVTESVRRAIWGS
jgi:hypothetical protein